MRKKNHDTPPVSVMADKLFAHLKCISDKRYRLPQPKKGKLSKPVEGAFMYFREILFLKTDKDTVWMAALGEGQKIIASEHPTLEPVEEYRIAFMPLPAPPSNLSTLFVKERKKESEASGIDEEPSGPRISKVRLADSAERKITDVFRTAEKKLLILSLENRFPKCHFSGRNMDEKADYLNGIFKGDFPRENATHLDTAQVITEEVLKVLRDTPQMTR